MELKKSYKGFVWFMLGFTAVMFLFCFLPIKDGGLITRLVCAEMTCGVALLAYIIYRTEYVYWYNGTEYEEAVAAGSERRKAFALAHFKRFAVCAVACVGYSVAAQLLGWPFWIDILLSGVGVIVAAISTIGIRL
ncbi:MAG: hypothetical protein E7316_05400 [Clostridiales bacterium]|nr:hypothetical protein [Clostridiales bacterium]